jgi:predicted RNase H-like HicB family nuclease
MSLDDYRVLVRWSAEDGLFIADVLQLPGCTAHGHSQEAAFANARDAMHLWIDTAREFGDAIPSGTGAMLDHES